jgi:hypothetical protein
MKALLQITTIESDTRWAKEIRVLGIPVYLERELNVKSGEKSVKRIGFQTIGDTSLLDTEEKESEDIDTTLYGKEKN